jgi:hypothetical protein
MRDMCVDCSTHRNRPGWLSTRSERALLFGSVAVAFAAGAAIRLVAGGDAPLWMDEAVTGVIAAQSGAWDMAQAALKDPNAPLFYALVHAWAGVAGLGNSALRCPSLICALLTPLIVLVPNPAIGRDVRLLWCALLALWWPGLLFAQEARCYTLLLALATGATVACARLLAAPGIGRAIVWSGLGALTILTHYQAAALIGVQGLAHVIIHRRHTVRTWPAALAFIPVVVWMALQSETLIRFADQRFAWYQIVDDRHLPVIAGFLFGLPVLAVWTILFGLWRLARDARAGLLRRDILSPAIVVVATSVAALAVMLIIGAIRPSFTIRYLIPCAPGILLGAALVAKQMNRRLAGSGLVYVLLFGIVAVKWAGEGAVPPYKRDLEIQSASETMIAARVERVVFVWDNPLFDAMDPNFARELGGFFFHRAGMSIVVEAVQSKDIAGLETTWSAAAGVRTGLLWVHEPELRGQAAMHYPPSTISDPGWRCSKTGQGPVGVIACLRL